MDKKSIDKLTNEELIKEMQKFHSSQVFGALFIGLLIGILIYSISAGNFSFFFIIIILYAIYKISTKNNYRKKEIEKVLKERNLK